MRTLRRYRKTGGAFRAGVVLLSVTILAVFTAAFAGGPWRVMGDGTPLSWGTLPLRFDLDAGSLGLLSHEQAAAQFQQALDAWNAVGVVSLFIDGTTPLPDVTAAGSPDPGSPHYLNYFFQEDAVPGDAVKVIFDDDGSIIEDLFGAGSSEDILGLTHIDTQIVDGPNIHEASIILNGAAFNGVLPDLASADAFRSVMMHEIGHALNLGHSALNSELAGDGDASNDRYLPTMYPLLADSEAELATLNPDDSAALTYLYGSSSNSIEGHVATSLEPFQGAQVTVRRVDPPPDAPPDAFLLEAYSSVSGFLYLPAGGSLPPPGLRDLWKVAGLPAGNYQVCVEQLDTSFSEANGTLVGPLATPPLIPGPEECYNLGDEGSGSTDDPDASTSVPVSGSTTGINIMLNDQPAEDPEDAIPGGNDTPATAISLGPGPVNTTYGLLTSGDLDFFSMPITAGDHLLIDVDAAELGYPTDAVIGLWDGLNNPVLVDGVQVRSDDGRDPDSGQNSFDPALEIVVDFAGPAKIGVSCYPDAGWAGCSTTPPRSYWLRVEVHHDTDGDGIVDYRDVCPSDPFNDADGDGECLDQDHCPRQPGLGSANDADGDGIADECDLCPYDADTDQANADGDTLGDLCDPCTDTDGDGHRDPGFPGMGCPPDNCPSFYNPSQADNDGDGKGDPCDPCPFDPSNGCVDTTAPTLDFTLPSDGQTGVSTSSDVLLFFGKAVDPVSADTVSILLEDPSGAKVAGTVSVSGNVVSFDPDVPLATGTPYTIQARPPLRDLAGNEIMPTTPVSFTTLGRVDTVSTDGIGATGGLAGTSAGGAPGDEVGFSVAMLGDMNGDAFDDYAYGSPSADVPPASPVTDAGKVTLVLGGNNALAAGSPTMIEFFGSSASQKVGQAVADAGNLDGNGPDDLVFAAPQPATDPARIWGVFGSTGWTGFAAGSTTTVNLGSPTLGDCLPPPGGDFFCGVVFEGNSADKPGFSLTRTADAGPPGSTVTDLLIGAPLADPAGKTDAGVAYLVFGSDILSGPGTLHGQILNLAGTGNPALLPGVVFSGENPGDHAGESVYLWANPDLAGVDDLIISAPLADTVDRYGTTLPDSGYVYAIHPGTHLVSGTMDLAQVGSPTPPTIPGVVFLGASPGGEVGRSTVGAVDLDGDGIPDVIYAADGEVYAVAGEGPKSVSSDSSSGPRNDISGTSQLRRINSGNAFKDFRTTRFFQPPSEGLPLRPLVVGGGGDLNGDGFDDFLIGDPQADSAAGRVYVVYGRPGWWPQQVSLADIGVTVPGLRLNAGSGVGLLGWSIDSGGDVNGDCLADAIVGAPGGTGGGKVFVFSAIPLPGGQNPVHLDADDDGFDACVDCNDRDPLVHPGASELCDGLDNNCDGTVDEGFADPDGDGYPSCRDCGPGNPDVHPGAAEICNELDDDCNGVADDTADADGDGFSTCTDCDDSNYSIFPGHPELCDGLDNDCDGSADEDFTNLGSSCTAGVGECLANGVFVCSPGGASTQCDAVPGSPSPEACDGLDNDCDGLSDEDGDGDGAGVCADCNDLDSGSFATPGEVLNLRFTGPAAIAWDPPASPGGTSIRYDAIRSGSPTGFVSSGICVESDDGADTQASDAAVPSSGGAFFYLTRAENDCPAAGQGPLGMASDGTPRSALNCP